MSPRAPVNHRRAVLDRATVAAGRPGRRGARDVLALLDAEFGPSELHVAAPDGLVAVDGEVTAADRGLLAAVVEHRRTSVGDGRFGAGTCLACPVLVGGRVAAVVAVSRVAGWEPATATLADGVVAIATPCLAAEQRRMLESTTRGGACRTEHVHRLVHDDAVQVLIAVAERLDLVLGGVVPEDELVALPNELRDVAARLAAGVGPSGRGS